MHKKPFHSGKKAFGNNDDAPYRKSSDRKEDRPFRQKTGDKDDKPFRKQFGNDEDRPFRKASGKPEDRPFKKPFRHDEDRPFKKKFDDKGDRPFKKSFEGKEDRPFRKSFDNKEERPFKKSFDNKEDRPFRKSFDNKEERPFKKSFDNKEDRPFRKSFDNKEDRPFKKSFDNREDRPFKKSFDNKEERPFRKSFEGKEDRPFRKSFGNHEDRPFKKSFGDKEDRPFKKSFDKGDKPFKKSFEDRGDRDFKKKEDKPVDRYKNTFGKLDDEELIQHQRKMQQKREQESQGDEITFSRELDKWSDEPVERVFGKSDIKPKKRDKDEPREPKSRFKKHFDNEKEQEKAYATWSEGNHDEANQTAPENLDASKPMPLNKYIAHCDVCSRRDAVTLIKEGKVTVNGELITEPGFKVTLEDIIALNGKQLVVQKNLVYILMNKPKGFITTTDDPKGRRTVMEMLENHIEERVFPVGRLDRNTTGLLLLTNDGELAQKLAHPKYEVRKVYKATLDKNLSKADFDKILEGVILEDGQAKVDELEYLETKNEVGMEIHSGKNRIVRRIFESLGYEVVKLDRVMYAGLTKKHVLRGKWRFLTKQEVINIKHLK
ncbi:pseudouridine synthase [Taibaiella chishuiensis]|uniref:Pseudouridine synthase n=1 Tax=Taibaiella chishuiensis TaxID=1434707 RepID=A0A2P8DAK6_9BACT|nr:pseudouridine synthase [Taibaiella chishuiensis]PSK94243.1 23S rRNA pseudouridine2605 synthase [Taibaiella chishuiensis]